MHAIGLKLEMCAKIMRMSHPVSRSPYPYLLAVFCAVFLISNITAQKGVQIGPLITDGAFFLFPISYVIGDVIAEVYGFKTARRAVFTGFGIAVLAVVSFYIAIWLPGAPFYDMQDTFEAVLGLLPRIVVASLTGYVVGQLLNAWVLQKMKDRFGTDNLWARLIGSTVVGEFADTLLFCSIAAGVIGIDSAGAFINYVAVGFFWKTIMEIVLLPITYPTIAAVRRKEEEVSSTTA
ncbi:queuosine precursor transporter [Corynebacterium sp. CCUG 69979]|nr:queuosine precursor transporter [Corynebacterium sp. CCUG 70398]MCQ4624494.1 queuosine precursor transporter [Corynebacterium sp. CCUG 69979]